MLGRLAVPFFIVCASFFLKPSLGIHRKMKAYLVKIVKPIYFGFCLPSLCLVFFLVSISLSISFQQAFWLLCSIWDVLPTLVYPGLLLGLFLVNQLVKRLGMVWTGVILSFFYTAGAWSETYSAYLDTTESSQGYQLYSNLFFLQREMVLFYTPIYLYGVITCMRSFSCTSF